MANWSEDVARVQFFDLNALRHGRCGESTLFVPAGAINAHAACLLVSLALQV